MEDETHFIVMEDIREDSDVWNELGIDSLSLA